MHNFSVEENLRKIMNKLSRKDPTLFKDLLEKIDEILHCEDVDHYKNLRQPLRHLKRVHIKEKVLVFKFDKTNNLISFEDFDHHDKIYKK